MTARCFKIFLAFLLAVSFNLFSQEDNIIPKRSDKLVNDYVGILSATEKNTLEQKLVGFNDSNSVQITIVIVDDLNGYAEAEYATMIGNEWGVGQKGFDNGVVILVKPTGGQGQRKAFIAVGYGLEPVIPDAIANRVVDNEMLPYFKNGQYYKGFDQATTVLMSLAAGEFTSEQYIKKTGKSPWLGLIPVFAILLVFLLMRVVRGSSAYSAGKKIPFWTAMMLMGSMGRGNSNSWNNFSGGSGSSGFGGFGGGGFGGGGAGGSW